MTNGTRPGGQAVRIAGEEIEFFYGPEEGAEFTPKNFGAGSLISTYRVVNTTLRAESEKTVAAVYDRRSGEFQLSSLSVEPETVWRSTD
jgi:hypothetical protein